MARVEKFLAEYLDGRYEPLEGESMPRSTAIVKSIGD
jgi:hypothetical protein